MAFRAKDRAALQPAQPSTLKTGEPGLCPRVCPSRPLLSIEQARMSPPGFPGVRPISAVGQSPKMAVPAPPSDSGSQTEPGCRAFCGVHLGPDTREGQIGVLGKAAGAWDLPGFRGS